MTITHSGDVDSLGSGSGKDCKGTTNNFLILKNRLQNNLITLKRLKNCALYLGHIDGELIGDSSYNMLSARAPVIAAIEEKTDGQSVGISEVLVRLLIRQNLLRREASIWREESRLCLEGD